MNVTIRRAASKCRWLGEARNWLGLQTEKEISRLWVCYNIFPIIFLTTSASEIRVYEFEWSFKLGSIVKDFGLVLKCPISSRKSNEYFLWHKKIPPLLIAIYNSRKYFKMSRSITLK